MTTSEIVTIVLTSAGVSSLVAFLLNYFFESRQQHRFEKEIADLEYNYASKLEKLKSEMLIDADIQHEITERRISNYPKLVELVYRTRNLSRELIEANPPLTLVEEFETRSGELEDSLYRFRLDLERDSIIGPIHDYKNLIKAYNRVLKDITIYQSRGTEEKIIQGVEQLKSIYSNIEDLHKSIIEKLSKKSAIG
jgi:hypothetical protein